MNSKEITLDAMRRLGFSEAARFQTKVESDSISGTEVIANENVIPRWRPGPYSEDACVRYEDQVYRVTQAHDSTSNSGWTPAAAVSLFEIYSQLN